MAGDWIKMRVDLTTHPKIVRIMSATKSDKHRVIGGLFAVWSIADAHASISGSDGHLEGYSLAAMSDAIGWPGFAEAMARVGWVSECMNPDHSGESCLIFTNFDAHNGKSAKRRAEDTERKRRDRAAPEARHAPSKVKDVSASGSDKKRTREEKSINTPISPSAAADRDAESPADATKEPRAISRTDDHEEAGKEGKGAEEPSRVGAVCMETWLKQCADEGRKPVPADSEVFAYATKVGLPSDFVALAWGEFKARNSAAGAKRYRPEVWPNRFFGVVRDNGYGLWAFDGQAFTLSSRGQQARAAQAA